MKREIGELSGQSAGNRPFRDYCPNGLQVEGRAEVRRIVAGVTASQALLDVAVAAGWTPLSFITAYFWKGEDGRVTGICPGSA